MLSVTDAKKVIDDLQKYPFICSDTKIVTESKYVIMTQKEYERLIEKSRTQPCEGENHHERDTLPFGVRSKRRRE